MHLIRMVAITLAVIACVFMPFLPGKYDTLAITLSIRSSCRPSPLSC
jgi:hypothetical protein